MGGEDKTLWEGFWGLLEGFLAPSMEAAQNERGKGPKNILH